MELPHNKQFNWQMLSWYIRLSQKFVSFYKEIIDAQHFLVLYYFIELFMIHFVKQKMLYIYCFLIKRKKLLGQHNT